jgi:pyruvate-formate lyase-activating enzyme
MPKVLVAIIIEEEDGTREELLVDVLEHIRKHRPSTHVTFTFGEPSPIQEE